MWDKKSETLEKWVWVYNKDNSKDINSIACIMYKTRSKKNQQQLFSISVTVSISNKKVDSHNISISRETQRSHVKERHIWH